MRRKRRNHKPEFKAKASLTAIQGELTMVEPLCVNLIPYTLCLV